MSLLYSLAIHGYYLALLLMSPFSRKAGLWITGRKGWRRNLSLKKFSGTPVYWFHAASLGEFEQGRSLIEAIRKKQPGCSIVLTFYSPSGYEVRKSYQVADLVCYLPLDTAYNARHFIRIIRPDAAFFIKYEFWFHYLKRMHDLGKPVYLVSGIFRNRQIFFRWYGSWFRMKLRFIRHFFLQDQSSAALLQSIHINNLTISGDTRFDRVNSIALSKQNIDIAADFVAGRFCIVAGSTWPEDEELLIRYINQANAGVALIIAPHEIHVQRIIRLASMVKRSSVLFSEAAGKSLTGYQVLIVNNIGQLSSLYNYGKIAYIGGGFGAGIHNILEPAASGLPVVFGPNYHKFREAEDLIRLGGAFAISRYGDFEMIIHDMTGHEEALTISAAAARDYVQSHTGATERIMNQLFT